MRLLEFARQAVTELDTEAVADRGADRGCTLATASASPRIGTQHGGEVGDSRAAAEIGAVLVYSCVLDAEVWLVRDEEALCDIALEIAGRPIFFFEEIERLRGKTVEELRQIAGVKSCFRGSRVLQ